MERISGLKRYWETKREKKTPSSGGSYPCRQLQIVADVEDG